MHYAERIRRLPPPDLSSEGTSLCDTTAAAEIGQEADTVFDAAEQLLQVLQPLPLPLEACERIGALAQAIHESRGRL